MLSKNDSHWEFQAKDQPNPNWGSRKLIGYVGVGITQCPNYCFLWFRPRKVGCPSGLKPNSLRDYVSSSNFCQQTNVLTKRFPPNNFYQVCRFNSGTLIPTLSFTSMLLVSSWRRMLCVVDPDQNMFGIHNFRSKLTKNKCVNHKSIAFFLISETQTFSWKYHSYLTTQTRVMDKIST